MKVSIIIPIYKQEKTIKVDLENICETMSKTRWDYEVIGVVDGSPDDSYKEAKKAGINNISLDVMLGVQEQTQKSLSETLDFCIASGAKHISAYMLKIEEGTTYYKKIK